MPFLYRFGVPIMRLWCKICGCRFTGQENIPADRAVLVIANHTSTADPILLACAFPQHITYIAKEEFLRNALTRLVFGKGLGAVFLNKEESDVSALRAAIKLMKNGRTVGIFPEGHRNYDQKITEFMPGAAFIALKAGVPVVPAAISNSRNLPFFWRRNMVVNIGRLIELESIGKITQEDIKAHASLLQQKVVDLYAKNECLLQAKKIKV